MPLLSKCFPCSSQSGAASDGEDPTAGPPDASHSNLQSRAGGAPATVDQDAAPLSPLESLQKTGAVGAINATSADILRFQANPVEFMRKNIVVVAALPRNESGENHPVSFCLYEWPTKTSTIGKVYRLSPIQNDTQPESKKIRAYLCDFHQDACPSIRVGRDANLLLTPTLSGCSIGVKPEHDGSLALCHANARTAPNQIEKQVTDIRARLGQDAIAINPNDYRDKDGDMATMVGVFHNDSWNIHFSSFGTGEIFNHSGFTRAVQIPVEAVSRDANFSGARSEIERGRARSHSR